MPPSRTWGGGLATNTPPFGPGLTSTRSRSRRMRNASFITDGLTPNWLISSVRRPRRVPGSAWSARILVSSSAATCCAREPAMPLLPPGTLLMILRILTKPSANKLATTSTFSEVSKSTLEFLYQDSYRRWHRAALDDECPDEGGGTPMTDRAADGGGLI